MTPVAGNLVLSPANQIKESSFLYLRTRCFQCLWYMGGSQTYKSSCWPQISKHKQQAQESAESQVSVASWMLPVSYQRTHSCKPNNTTIKPENLSQSWAANQTWKDTAVDEHELMSLSWEGLKKCKRKSFCLQSILSLGDRKSLRSCSCPSSLPLPSHPCKENP